MRWWGVLQCIINLGVTGRAGCPRGFNDRFPYTLDVLEISLRTRDADGWS